MPLSEARRRSAGLGCRATTFGGLLAGIPSLTSEVAGLLVCGAGFFFGFATEREAGFLGMTDVYLKTSNNSQSCIASGSDSKSSASNSACDDPRVNIDSL